MWERVRIVVQRLIKRIRPKVLMILTNKFCLLEQCDFFLAGGGGGGGSEEIKAQKFWAEGLG